MPARTPARRIGFPGVDPEVDMQHDRYRPQTALRCRAVLGADGRIEVLNLQTAVGSINRSLGRDLPDDGIEPQAVEGLANQPYDVANLLVECVLKSTHIPVMFWRSVGSSQNAFVVESFIDELAASAGEDPYRYRRRLLHKRPDFQRVLDAAAQKAGWDAKLPQGRGRGIAIHQSFGTIVAQVADVTVGRRVTSMWTASWRPPIAAMSSIPASSRCRSRAP